MQRPNFLIFMTDQQRGDTVPPYGRAVTPYLDRFAREGVSFSQAFCPSPHCCPSRATFFTGLYPSQHGVWNNVDVGNALSRGLFSGTRLWSDGLREAGYQLRFSGKWHVSVTQTPADFGWQARYPAGLGQPGPGADAPAGPVRYEWERYENFPAGADHAQRGEGEILRPGYGTYTHYGLTPHDIVDFDEHVIADALEVIAASDPAAPWCQFVGTLGPHDPYFVPPEFLDLYDLDDIELPANFNDRMLDKPALYRRTRERFDQLTEREHREAIRRYLAFCSYEDALFGRLLAALEASGQSRNTVVLYLSDHGDYNAEHGLWCKGLPCFRSAYHIPAIVRWPAGIEQPGRDVDAFVSLADFAPTFLELAGAQAPGPMAGQSLAPFLAGSEPATWRDALFTQSNGNELYGIQRSVMTREWKYVYNGFDYDELYDLRHDPREMVNLAADPAHASTVRRLCERMWRFAHDHDDVAINPYVMVALAPWGPACGLQSSSPSS